MATLLRPRQISNSEEEELGGQMSFLDHLDELRRRLIRSLLFVFLAMTVCWFFSDRIYSFLAVPVEWNARLPKRNDARCRSRCDRKMSHFSLASLKENDLGRDVFPEETQVGDKLILPVPQWPDSGFTRRSESTWALYR